MNVFFVFFLVSGFCGLVYQVVWLRLTMAQFGVTTPFTSIVLSVFMAGLALGSWLGGVLARRVENTAGAALRLYAVTELLIATSGIVVAAELAFGRRLIGGAEGGVAWGSAGYYLASGAWVVVTLLPFCTCMGATFPLAMAAIRGRFAAASERSFSYLYVANVLGALAGTVVSAFVLIELLGFRATALVAGGLNALLGLAAFAVAGRFARDGAQGARAATASAAAAAVPREDTAPPAARAPGAARDAAPDAARAPDGSAALRSAPWLLFATGLMSLAMEVVWIRQFTPYLGTVVYSFAAVIALYLVGTIIGSRAYRAWAQRAPAARLDTLLVPGWAAIGLTALLPILAADPRIPLSVGFLPCLARVAIGIVPFCAVVGFLTPMLVDRWSQGDPARAGSAYAMNVVGCIVGPLVSGFVLLPRIGEPFALVVLAVVPVAAGLAAVGRPAAPAARRGPGPLALIGIVAATAAFLLIVTRTFEDQFPNRIVKRDYTATVIAQGEGFQRQLIVNGSGMTALTPLSKFMAHLPLAFLQSPPSDGLVICFGMGTSFRSMMTWPIRATAVELVPSVPGLFGFYHADGPEILKSDRARVVVDDGRRFMERNADQYDVITIDPPPPVEAAGSSLLYTHEFYEVAKKRLKPGGILQQWFPGGEAAIESSVMLAIQASFPHVRSFRGLQGWGFHTLASESPIPETPASVLIQRMPPAATADLGEWIPQFTPEQILTAILSYEVSPDSIASLVPGIPMLADDRPVNEYFLLRRTF